MMNMIVRLFLFGDAPILYLLYSHQVKSEEESWLRGLGNMPDKNKTRRTYLLIWAVLQVIKLYWLFVGIANFPAQR